MLFHLFCEYGTWEDFDEVDKCYTGQDGELKTLSKHLVQIKKCKVCNKKKFRKIRVV